MKKLKVILSGGGTGGHIYPAVSVAEALERRLGDNVEILFVGAEGRMEMEKIPALGYEIKGLPVAGLQRKLSASNLKLPFKVLSSVRSAKRIIRDFGADVAAGFGGYASAPVLWAAQRLGVPTLIQEQNSYPGLTNKILSKRADRICVAYDGLERFFQSGKIIHTGNPLRGSFGAAGSRAEALGYFGLKDGRPVVLIVGGSLGSRTLNNAMKRGMERIAADNDVQYIWQTGKYYENEIKEFMAGRAGASGTPAAPNASGIPGGRPGNTNATVDTPKDKNTPDGRAGAQNSPTEGTGNPKGTNVPNAPGIPGGSTGSAGNPTAPTGGTGSTGSFGTNAAPADNIWYGAFIDRMDMAYAAADVVVSRAGAGAVSELCLVGKPAIFVPSPNVSEDHQTRNAMALVNKQAAILVTDPQAEEMLIDTVAALIADRERMAGLIENIKRLGIADSADRVAEEIIRLGHGV